MNRLGKADTEKRALMRDKYIKKGKQDFEGPNTSKIYIDEILSHAKLQTKLDVGCGTGHILQRISEKMSHKGVLVGLDLSEAMVRIAKENTSNSSNVIIVRGDSFKLPFPDLTFDMVINRLAEYSLEEIHRVLKVGGYFIKFGTGPRDCLEIAEFFGGRYAEKRGPHTGWKERGIRRHERAGFIGLELNDFDVIDYHTKENLVDIIELVPLVKGFDRRKDGKIVDKIEEKHCTKRGIAITRQIFILKGRKKSLKDRDLHENFTHRRWRVKAGTKNAPAGSPKSTNISRNPCSLDLRSNFTKALKPETGPQSFIGHTFC